MDYLPALSRKKTARDRDPEPRLLIDWYGKEDGSSAITARLPEPKRAGDLVEKVLATLAPPEMALLETIRRRWDDIAGDTLSRFVFPARFFRGVLELEVAHPAYLSALGKAERAMLLDKINALEGGSACASIRMIPKGSLDGRERR
jgi:hypothetical protein